MPFISKKTVANKKYCFYKCDQCGKIYHREGWRKRLQTPPDRLTFCSNACFTKASLPGGKVDQKREKVFLKNFGKKNPMHDQKFKKKCQDSFFKKYGVSSYQLVPELEEKRRNTCIEKYGFDFAAQNKDVKRKIAKTNIERYGHTTPSGSPIVREKTAQTCLKRYGVKYPLQDPTIKTKAFDRKNSRGNIRTSSLEDDFHKLLVENFSNFTIKRQVRVGDYLVDFFIDDLDLYVEFDGEYWHGHNKTIQDLEGENNSRSKCILKKKLKDSRQNTFFKKGNLKLLRFTDRQYKNNSQYIIDCISNMQKISNL